ncbi:MFS transporter [Rhodococcus sp. NPDC127530]|uniref:MFS transporter n=1 Tax=unclassified Rhodococcus (in: high G+C Gram-positive bacteria) TaxID=192944 RepID=UPI00362EBE39
MTSSTSKSAARSTPPKSVHKERFPLFAVIVLAFTGFLSLTTELLPAGLLTDIAPDLNVGLGVAGLLTSAYAIGNVVTVIPLTRLAIKFSRRSALVVIVLLFVVSNLMVAFTPSVEFAIAGRFIGGAAHGVIWALLPSVVARMGGAHYVGRAMTIVFTANSLALAVGAPLGSLLGDATGWRVAFMVAALIALVIALVLGRVVPSMHSESTEHVTLAKAAMLPGALRVCVAWALIMLGHFAVLTYIAPYLERLGVGAGITGLSLFILGGAGIIGVTLAGRLGQRSLITGLIAAPALIAVSFLVLLLTPPALPVVLIVLVFWGMGFSGTVMLYQQAVLATGRRAPETVTSISVVLSQLGIALGATVGGIGVEAFGVQWLPLIGLAFAAGALLLLPGLRRNLHPLGKSDEDIDMTELGALH